MFSNRFRQYNDNLQISDGTLAKSVATSISRVCVCVCVCLLEMYDIKTFKVYFNIQ